MNYQLTPIQLNDEINRAINIVQDSDKQLFDILELLYLTGIRANEVFNLSSWSILDAYYMRLVTSKSNEIRIVHKSNIPYEILKMYENQVSNFYHNYATLLNDIKKILPKFYFGTFINASPIHCFRYNYIKQMKLNGFSNQAIKLDLAHVNQATTDYYINADIFIIKP